MGAPAGGVVTTGGGGGVIELACAILSSAVTMFPAARARAAMADASFCKFESA